MSPSLLQSPFLTPVIVDELHLKSMHRFCHSFGLMSVFGIIYKLCQDSITFIAKPALYHLCHGHIVFIMVVYKLQLTDSWFTQTHSVHLGTN